MDTEFYNNGFYNNGPEEFVNHEGNPLSAEELVELQVQAALRARAATEPEAEHYNSFNQALSSAYIQSHKVEYHYLSDDHKRRFQEYILSTNDKLKKVKKNERVMVPIGFGDQKVPATIKEVSACRREITEKRVILFNNYMKEKLGSEKKEDKDFIEIIQKVLFPVKEGMDDTISEGNKYKDKRLRDENYRDFGLVEEIGLFKNYDAADIRVRQGSLIKLIKATECPEEFRTLFGLAFDILKLSQVIQVEFEGQPSTFGYYVAHDCVIDNLHYVAENVTKEFPGQTDEDKQDGVIPVMLGDTIKSILPSMYTLEEITEINSWISHGILSLYMMNPAIVRDICMNPLIGGGPFYDDDDGGLFWKRSKEMLNKQLSILHRLSKPTEADMIVFRGSRHFKNEPVRLRSIFPTSTNVFVANLFSGGEKGGKKILIPRGTRILDLTKINKKEKEILIFPAGTDTNMIVEKVSNANPADPNDRTTYRIRNANANRNRHIPLSRRRKSRRSSRQRQTRRRR